MFWPYLQIREDVFDYIESGNPPPLEITCDPRRAAFPNMRSRALTGPIAGRVEAPSFLNVTV
jgi:hypothetical protein